MRVTRSWRLCLGVLLSSIAAALLVVLWSGRLRRTRQRATNMINALYSRERKSLPTCGLGPGQAERVDEMRTRFGRVLSWKVTKLGTLPIVGAWEAEVLVSRTRVTTKESLRSNNGKRIDFYGALQLSPA